MGIQAGLLQCELPLSEAAALLMVRMQIVRF